MCDLLLLRSEPEYNYEKIEYNKQVQKIEDGIKKVILICTYISIIVILKIFP